MTKEKTLFLWLVVNAVFLSSFGLFPWGEGGLIKPTSKGNSSACISAGVLASRGMLV